MSPRRRGEATTPGAVWFRETTTPTPTPGLTRARIVAAAVEVLDARGVEGLSLRRVARALDVHATSLYWHVATRDDLLDLCLDEVLGELDLPADHEPDWTADLAAYMHGLRGLLLRHPWSGGLASSRPLGGPRALARSEFVYAALARGGFTGAELSAAAAAVTNLVIASAAAQAAWAHHDETTARGVLAEYLAAHPEQYPTLAANTADLLGDDWDSHFTRSTNVLLRGLATPST